MWDESISTLRTWPEYSDFVLNAVQPWAICYPNVTYFWRIHLDPWAYSCYEMIVCKAERSQREDIHNGEVESKGISPHIGWFSSQCTCKYNMYAFTLRELRLRMERIFFTYGTVASVHDNKKHCHYGAPEPREDCHWWACLHETSPKQQVI